MAANLRAVLAPQMAITSAGRVAGVCTRYRRRAMASIPPHVAARNCAVVGCSMAGSDTVSQHFGWKIAQVSPTRRTLATLLGNALAAFGHMFSPATPSATRHASMHLPRLMAWLAAFALCSHEPALAVVGGRVVSADEVSARGIVGLRSQGGRLRRGACTGTLIAPNLVLTARHCLDQAEDGPLSTVIFGG